jgi:S1-C subfamily serine protease
LTVWWVTRPSPVATAAAATSGSSPSAGETPTRPPAPASRPASRPATPPIIAALPATVPVLQAPPPPATTWDRQQLLKDNVGLCVTVVRYEGPVGGQTARIDIAISSGTAFAVHSSGIMLTNRHVVEIEKGKDQPPITLDSVGLPMMVLRDTSYVVCFGSNASDRYAAKVLHRSDTYDVAVLQVGKHFQQPLKMNTKALRQGDDIIVCGFPGAVTAALNSAANTPAKAVGLRGKWQSSHQIDAFDEFSPDSFNSTVTRGIVSAPERNVRSVSYVQIDAVISPGNSGGPVLNQTNDVVGIATFGIRSQNSGVAGNYNFALQLEQIQDELRPYLRN